MDLNRKKHDVVRNNEPINQSTCCKYGTESSNHLKFVEYIGFSDRFCEECVSGTTRSTKAIVNCSKDFFCGTGCKKDFFC